jgi:hypothetical protein
MSLEDKHRNTIDIVKHHNNRDSLNNNIRDKYLNEPGFKHWTTRRRHGGNVLAPEVYQCGGDFEPFLTPQGEAEPRLIWVKEGPLRLLKGPQE